MPQPTREGYTFAGWYDDAQFAGAPVASLPAAMPAGTTTYYAKWIAGDVTITFDAMGGSNVTVIAGKAGEGLPSTELPTTVRAGYAFEGWFDNAACEGTPLSALPDVFPATDVTFWAKWSALDASIAFDAAGGSFAEGTEGLGEDGRVVWTGATDQAVGKPALPTVTRDGFTFGGWMSADGTTLSGVPDAYGAGHVTYTAQWNLVGNGSVAFVFGNGEAPLVRTGVAGDAVGAFPDEPTREGYTFAGWFDNADCTGDAVESLDGVTFVENAMLGYWAKWAPNKVTLSFDVDGGDPSSVTLEGLVGEKLASTQFPAVSKPGYVLGGWFTTPGFDEGTRVESLPDVFPTQSETYYVKWVAAPAKLVFHPMGGTLDVTTYEGVTAGATGLSAMPEPTREGYTFAGWFDNAACAGSAVAAAPAAFAPGTTEFWAKWSANTVTFKRTAAPWPPRP